MRVRLGVALLALATAVMVVQAQPANAAGGNQDCAGKGKVAVSAEYKQASGLRVNVKQDGPPTAPTWARQVDPGPNLYPVQWTLRSPYTSGGWGASTVDDRYGGLEGARAQCSERAAPADRVLERQSLPDKDCPAGQTVIINSGGFGDHWYFWRNSSSANQQRVLNAERVGVDVDRLVDTGMNSIVDVRIEAHPGTSTGADDWINVARTWCSATLGVHAG